MNKIVLISAVLASLFTTEAMADTINNETNNVNIEQTENNTCNGCVFVGDKGSYTKTTRQVDRYEEHIFEVIEQVN